MKALIIHQDESVGGVQLGKGTHTVEALAETDVKVIDLANLVARGRAAWSHDSPVEKPAPKKAKRQAPGDE